MARRRGGLVASAATWVVAQTILTGLARYGEKLSAVVGLIAIGMLLVILNWFFHKTYWTGHLAGLHGKKQAMLTTGGIALAQVIALATLGFTSVYREGFETVLFVQALVLATDLAHGAAPACSPASPRRCSSASPSSASSASCRRRRC